MKVLAVGAAGSSAGLVVAALARRGIEVRGLVHAPAKQGAATRNGAIETVVADLQDRDALARAVEGVDGVFHIIPAFAPDEAGMGTALVEVAADASISRFVFSSVYHPSLTDLSNHAAKQPAEQALYNSEMDFVILQPAMFMSQLSAAVASAKRTGVIAGPYSVQSRMSYVDYRDVAEVAAESFVNDRFSGGSFELAAPGMFSRVDLAGLLGETLGREVRAEQSPPPAEDGAGMPPAMASGLRRMLQHYDDHGFHGGNALVLTTMLGHDPRPFPDTSPKWRHDEHGSQHHGPQHVDDRGRRWREASRRRWYPPAGRRRWRVRRRRQP